MLCSSLHLLQKDEKHLQEVFLKGTYTMWALNRMENKEQFPAKSWKQQQKV